MRESWRPNKDCNILTPPNSSGYHSLSFPFFWAAQPGPRGPSLCWHMVLIPASSLQLTRTSCAPSYIIVLRPLNPNRQQSRLSPDTLNRMHLLFTQVYFFFWQLCRVGGQYATLGHEGYCHKMYSTYLKALGLEPHHQMKFSAIFRTLLSGVDLSSL